MQPHDSVSSIVSSYTAWLHLFHLKSKCVAHISLCSQQDFFDRLHVMYTVGYAVSFSALLVAILIIGYFRYERTFKYLTDVLFL